MDWPDESWNFDSVQALDENSASQKFEITLYCVKGYDWESAALLLSRFPAETVFTFQNGVLVHHELANRYSGRVSGAVIYVSADRVEPGHVVSKSQSRAVLDGSASMKSITEPLAAALQNEKLKVALADDMELALWRKYLFLSAFSAVNTLTEKPVGPILQEDATRELLFSFLNEIVRLANVAGVPLNEADVEKTMEDAAKFPPATTSSLFADYSRKRPTEVELLHGHLVRLAQQHKVDVPVIRAIYSLLKLKTAV
jgi:2-dehydropantoate 2-reductase